MSVLPGAGRPGATPEAGALAIWGMLGGAISAVSLAALFTRVEDDERRGLAAMLLTLVCPLFWFTASRALSDMPGFACVLASQALAAAAFARQRGWSARAREEGQGSIVAAEVVASGRLIVLSALDRRTGDRRPLADVLADAAAPRRGDRRSRGPRRGGRAARRRRCRSASACCSGSSR